MQKNITAGPCAERMQTVPDATLLLFRLKYSLALARQNGDVLSPAQENLFLTRWLATALKQRRFSRDVAPDIE